MKTEDILNERKNTHGDFETASFTHHNMKELLRGPMQANGLPFYRIEAIEAIIGKINRIVHGNHDHADHWDDIAGYAMLGRGKQQRQPETEETEFARSWLPKCHICEKLLPPKPYDCYLDGKPVHSGCYTPGITSFKMEHALDKDELCDYDPSNCEICEYHMTPWSNGTWKLHKKSSVKKERCKACKSKSCCDEECPLNPLTKCSECSCMFESRDSMQICNECLLQHVHLD